MFAVSLRRFRSESVATCAVLAAVGVLALVTGTMMSDHFRASGLSQCLATSSSGCDGIRDEFGRRFESLQAVILPLVLLPALLGAFVGAPLIAREIESGTHRFLWTQGVIRRRWFVVMAMTAVGLATIAGAIYSAIAAPWLDVTNQVTGERFGRMYDFQGVLPIAACILAVALGVACGVVLRRTIPAMALTIGIFVVVRLFVATQLRPRFASPLEQDLPGFQPDDPTGLHGAWVLSRDTLTSDGVRLGSGGGLNLSNLGDRCPELLANPGSFPERAAVDQCLDAVGVHQLTRYHPASRFWTFQLVESGLYITIGALALLFAGRLIVRRRT